MRSTDTVYVTASADRQGLFAPLIVGLLEEIRYATYRRHGAEGRGEEPRRAHVAFVLDEVANTAPLPLTTITSEAGGQGLHVLAATPDLSQARVRWGRAADGFLTLFKVKVILPGVGDSQTLEALSAQIGEYDRLMVTYGHSQTPTVVGMLPITQPSWSTTNLVQLTPYHARNPWPAIGDDGGVLTAASVAGRATMRPVEAEGILGGRGSLVAVVLLVALAGGVAVLSRLAGGGGAGRGGLYQADGFVLESPDHGPELCGGGVAMSLPPRCRGIPLVTWRWSELAGPEERAGTTWGSAHVVGRWDGRRLTLTAPPDPARPPPPEITADLSPVRPNPGAVNLEEIQRRLPAVLGQIIWQSHADHHRGIVQATITIVDARARAAVERAFGRGRVELAAILTPVGPERAGPANGPPASVPGRSRAGSTTDAAHRRILAACGRRTPRTATRVTHGVRPRAS